MATLLRYLAAAACVVVLAGFAAFAADEVGRGSDRQLHRLDERVDEPAPGAVTESAREQENGAVRELLDDANDVLLAPFTGVTSPTDDIWVKRGLPALLALVAYGIGLLLFANFLPKPRVHGGDWQAPDEA